MATPDVKLLCLNSQGSTLFSVNQTVGTFCVKLIQSNSTNGNFNLNNQSSTNSTTGSIIAYGGLSIANTTNSASPTQGGALTVAGGASINNDLLLGGQLNGTTLSTGSLGACISTGNIQISGNITVGGNLIVLGSSLIMNVTTANITDTNITASGIYITSGGLQATFNSNTLGNIFTTSGNVGINQTSPQYSLDISGNERLTGNLYVNTCSAANMTSTTTTLPNSILVNISSSSLNITGITSSNLLNTGLISTASIFATTSTLPNFVFTNASNSTLNTSIGITSAALLVSGLISSSNLYATTSTLPNVVLTNLTTVNILSTGITSSTLLVTGLVSTANVFATTSTLPNVTIVNASCGTLNISTGITSSALSVSGLISAANIFATTATVSNFLNTNISTGTIVATNSLLTNTSCTNLISTNGTTVNLVSSNSTTSNAVITNGIISGAIITSGTVGTLFSSNSTIGNGLITNLVATNLLTTTATIPSLVTINATMSNLLASVGLTTGNINFTGNLYQNGALYISSQWTGTSGTSLFYGSSGNITIGIGTTNPSYTLDVNGTARFVTGISVGSVNITNNLNMNSSVYHNTYGSYLTNNTTSALIYDSTIAGPMLYGQGGGMLGYNGNVNVLSWNSVGNVGIGTTNQAYSLDINGTTRHNGTTYVSSGNMYVYNGNQLMIQNNAMSVGVNDLVRFGQGDSANNEAVLDFNYIATGSASNSLGLGLFGALNKMVINGAGSVGIGTTNPVTTLDVVGTGRFTTNLTTGALYSTNITSTNAVLTNSTLSNIVSTNNTMNNLAVTNGTFTSITGSNLFVTNETISSLAATSSTLGSVFTTNTFSASFNSNTIGNLFTTGGNIGINTTSPGYKFDVQGITRINNTSFSSNSTTGALISLGGISITGTNSSANTAGGALTVAGGLAVSQDTYIGGNLFVQGINSSVITGITFVGSQSSTGVYQVTVTIGRTMSNTNYKVLGNLSTTTANTNTYTVSFSSLTTTTFVANILRMEAFQAAWLDPNLNLSWCVHP